MFNLRRSLIRFFQWAFFAMREFNEFVQKTGGLPETWRQIVPSHYYASPSEQHFVGFHPQIHLSPRSLLEF